MSNQNNTMNNLELRSSVNLNRYKNKVSNVLTLNGCNMPVVGDKYAPMTKGYVTDDEYIYDDGENFITYNRDTFGSSNKYVEYKPELKGYDFDAIGGPLYDDIASYGFKLEDGHVYFYTFDENNTLLNRVQVPYISYVNDKKFFCKKLGTLGYYFLISTETGCQIYSTRDNRQSVWFKLGLAGICKMAGIENFTSMSSYTPTGNVYDCYILKDKGSDNNELLSAQIITSTDEEIDSLSIGDDPSVSYIKELMSRDSAGFGDIFILDYAPLSGGQIGVQNSITMFVNGYAYTEFYNEDTGYIVNCNPIGYYGSGIIDNFTNTKCLDWNIEYGNDFTVSVSYKYGGNRSDATDEKFKLFSTVTKRLGLRDKLVGLNWVHTLTSIEYNGIKNNFIQCVRYGENPSNYTFQGPNLIFNDELGYDVVDYSKECYDGSLLLYKSNNGSWIYKSETELNNPVVIGNKIYSGNNIATVKNNIVRTEKNAFADSNLNLTINGDFEKVFNNTDDWTAQARYMVFGVSSPITEPLFTIQLPPFLAVVNKSNNPTLYNKYFFIQKDATDAALYNLYGETYTAPTDSDFYIPIVNTDRVDGSITNDIVITRFDGTTAKLIKYNNMFLPMYSYSGIEQNIEYTFIIQGQYYNVSDGVIVDSNGIGICSVKGLKYIGCNGILALYYNERVKKIYSFNASNTFEELISCDNIKDIIRADLSNTNDEIYILFKTYDNTFMLICIENDGQCYSIVEDVDIEKFMIGTNAIYVWENVQGTIKAYGYRLITSDDIKSDNNNYIETSYIGTDEFKMLTIDRLYLRLVPVNKNGDVNSVIVTINYLTLNGEVSEQHIIENPTIGYFRISPTQKKCLGFSIRIDNLVNYTVAALSVGITDDSNMVVNDTAKPLVHDSKTFNVDMFD